LGNAIDYKELWSLVDTYSQTTRTLNSGIQ